MCWIFSPMSNLLLPFVFFEHPHLTRYKRGYGENLIWARMNIYETEHFQVAYQQAPELTIRDNVHVGIEVLY